MTFLIFRNDILQKYLKLFFKGKKSIFQVFFENSDFVTCVRTSYYKTKFSTSKNPQNKSKKYAFSTPKEKTLLTTSAHQHSLYCTMYFIQTMGKAYSKMVIIVLVVLLVKYESTVESYKITAVKCSKCTMTITQTIYLVQGNIYVLYI